VLYTLGKKKRERKKKYSRQKSSASVSCKVLYIGEKEKKKGEKKEVWQVSLVKVLFAVKSPQACQSLRYNDFTKETSSTFLQKTSICGLHIGKVLYPVTLHRKYTRALDV
jgi:hypothetical protein